MMQPHRNHARQRRTATTIIAALLLTLMASIDLSAQVKRWLEPTTLPPMKKMYNVPDTEFTIGVFGPPPASSGTQQWQFLDSMGINLLFWMPEYWGYPTWDGLASDRLNSRERFTPEFRADFPTNGQQAVFFPFDSSQSIYWQCQFSSVRTNPKGEVQQNATENGASEVVYDSTGTTLRAGDSVAWGLLYRTPRPEGKDTTTSYTDLVQYRSLAVPTYYVAVTGHLIPLLVNGPGDSAVLQIKVVYQIDSGQTYVDANDTPHVATSNMEVLYTTINVSKDSLAPRGSDPFDKYQTVSYEVNLDKIGSTPGPLHAGNQSHRFDLRVFWTGAEKVALRSVILRDSLGELILGHRPASDHYRDSLREQARRLLYGPSLNDTAQSNAVFYIQVGHEPPPAYAAAYAAIDSLLRTNFHHAGDTAFAGVVENASPTYNLLGDMRAIHLETGYMNNLTPAGGGSYHTTYAIPPQIREHNGGTNGGTRDSLGVPELTLDSLGISDYEESLQRVWYGWYAPAGYIGYPSFSLWLMGLGRAAEFARRTGRPLMPIGGTQGTVGKHLDSLRVKRVNDTLMLRGDTGIATARRTDMLLQAYTHLAVGHFVEPAEMRLTANLGLCYGAHAYSYWEMRSDSNTMQDSMVFANTTFHYGMYNAMAPVGFLSSDTTINVRNYTIRNPFWDYGTDTIPNLYVGWQTRSREVKWIDGWLRRMGEEMMRRGLRWRDGYSIHYGTARPFPPHTSGEDGSLDSLSPDTNSPRPLRPLPSNEIVTKVESRSIDGKLDSAWATYVELGFFYTKTDLANNPMHDVNHIYVVNRRAYERSPEILYHSDSTIADAVVDSARAYLMDSLTETRLIKLRLNLKHPDSVSQYNFVRVREIQTDTTSLPHMRKIARVGLDTCVYADSAVTLMLGPGRAALLEIRYLDPAAPIRAGDLRFNNQRKLLWDGRRYHLVFHKDTLGDSRIYYRRSVYTHSHNDSDISTGGQIHWEPTEIVVSDTAVHGNVFPSLTLDTEEGDTIITIVWDRRKSSDSGNREIVLRKLRYNGAMGDTATDTVEHVAYHWGYDSTQWGTPTVSALDFGEAIAWSDSTRGIQARLRTHGWWGEDPYWWRSSSARYSFIATVESNVWTPWEIQRCQYPSMPTFTHITARDSTCSIVWQQQHIWFDPAPFNTMHDQTDIHYARLRDSTGDSLVAVRNKKVISSSNTDNYHPSIDLVQDVWLGGYEGITWESVARTEQAGGDPPPDPAPDEVYINFASLYTPDSTWSPIGPWRSFLLPTQQWTSTMRAVGTIPHGTIPSYWPNTASLNYRYDSTTQNELILFAVVYHDSTAGTMQQDLMHFALGDSSAYIFWPNPNSYLFGGIYPTMSANRVIRAGWLPDSIDTTTTPPDTIHWNFRAEGWDREPVRPAAIYIDDPGDSLLRTSKQFFAKSRPSGYMATGRAAIFRLNDSLGTRISVGLHDVWYASDSSGHAAAMVVRDSSLHRTDSLQQVQALLRTKNFHASDSVEIGCEVFGTFIGDSTSGGTARLTCRAELVDSANGAVVAQLDSFVIASSSRWHHEVKAPIVDLLSGTYFVRLRVDTASLPSVAALSYANYPVTEVFSWVGEDHLGKLTKFDGTSGAKARISAQPNPFGTTTEIRFSIPRRDYATVRVYDKLGHEVATLLERRYMEAGRYALEFDGSALPAGAYLVELQTSRENAVEKLVLVR